MKRLSSLSLKSWLPLLALVLFIILMLSMTWQAYRVAEISIIESSSRAITQDLYSLKREIEKDLARNDWSSAAAALTARNSYLNYRTLIVIDGSNKLSFSSDLASSSYSNAKAIQAKQIKSLDWAVLSQLRASRKAEVLLVRNQKKINAYLLVDLSINNTSSQSKKSAVIFLNYDLSGSKNPIWENVQQTILPLAAILSFSMLILIGFLQKYIIKPIEHIKRFAVSFSETSATNDILLIGSGELLELSQVFEKMLIKRRLYEYQLKKTNEKLSETLSELAEQKYALDQHSLVAITNIEGSITYVNDRFCSTSGYSQQELLGKNHRMLSSKIHDENFFQRMYQTISKGLVWHGEICNRSKYGHLYWLDTTIVPFMGKDKKPKSYVTIRTDITHRNMVLAKLAESEKNLLLAQKTAQLGHFSFNFKTSKWTCSDELIQIFGINSSYKKDFEGWIHLVHIKDREQIRKYLLHDILKQHRQLNKEYRIIDLENDQEKWVHAIGQLKFDENNKAAEMFGTIQDITHRKQVEIALQRAKKMEAIGQLTGGIAHDFNNILGIIIGNLDLLREQFSESEKAKKRILSASKAASRAANLTKQLLGFSQLKATESKITDVNRLIKNFDDVINHSLGQRIKVHYNLDLSSWTTKIDRGELQDVLLNLLLNARDAMDNEGVVTIETKNKIIDKAFCNKNNWANKGEFVQLSVIDSGEGISKEHQAKVFEPFFTTKPQSKGSGLGLAMVFGFVKRSNGYIEVNSQLNTGTRFNLYLPRCKTNEKVAEGSQYPNQKIKLSDQQEEKKDLCLLTRQQTLLIVDDEKELLQLAKITLQTLGYKVLTASNTVEALNLITYQPNINLLFSDIVMPGKMNGFELAKKIHLNYPNIRILLTSGYTGSATLNKNQTSCSFELLNKPYTQHAMVLAINKILNLNGETLK